MKFNREPPPKLLVDMDPQILMSTKGSLLEIHTRICM